MVTTLFVTGTKEEMETIIKECVMSPLREEHTLSPPGCELPYISTLDRVHFFTDAVYENGYTRDSGLL
jgi:uroporphyrinogen-III decarboxylase